MDWHDDPTTQKLWRSFMRFGRAQWHGRSVAGCTQSEIRVLFCLHRGVFIQPGEAATPAISEFLQVTKTRCATPAGPLVKVSDISKVLHVTPPSITQLIKGLEAKGLVERDVDPADRRVVRLMLTAQGEDVVRQAHAALVSALHGLMARLGEAESDHLADLLNKASEYYEEKAETHGDIWREEEVNA